MIVAMHTSHSTACQLFVVLRFGPSDLGMRLVRLQVSVLVQNLLMVAEGGADPSFGPWILALRSPFREWEASDLLFGVLWRNLSTRSVQVPSAAGRRHFASRSPVGTLSIWARVLCDSVIR